ncbi:MAG: glycosyltransferase family 2 protein [Gemmatimonadales bacterium]
MSAADLLPALAWAAPFATLPRLADRQPDLSSALPIDGTPASVIIPARNEAETIATAVRSILASTYRPLELIVVDDRSTDHTAAIVSALATQDSRLRLLSGAPLPPGWYGKPWACAQGAAVATGALLLFTDADTRHEPELLARTVGALRQAQADLLTVAPHQRCVTFWERVVMPQILLLLGFRYHPKRVNRARRTRDVIANGQFILTTREAYDAVGTHAAVRQEVAEDLALAQTYLRDGRRIHFAFADRLMETRMYRSRAQLFEGWTKNLYLGARRSFPDRTASRLFVALLLAAAPLFWLLPPGILLANALGADVGRISAAALAATAASALFWILVCYGMKIPAAYGLGYPIGAAATLSIVVRSVWRGAGRVEWRGRVYRSDDPESPPVGR